MSTKCYRLEGLPAAALARGHVVHEHRLFEREGGVCERRGEQKRRHEQQREDPRAADAAVGVFAEALEESKSDGWKS
jgi:hypothetical protein